ncbi:MAG TPA: recombinase family protein [Ktedonobacterales bacterium]|nr:recombinase family protein [Ktedonobacterales bacterium]
MTSIATTPQGSSPSAHARTAWIYVRESQMLSASGWGPDTQKRLCEELAAEYGYTETRIFFEVKSGATMKKRPTWQYVQRGVLRHECDALIVWQYSRIARKQSDWAHFIDRAINAGVTVLSTDPKERQWDWNTPQGRFALSVIGGVNEMYKDATRDATMGGVRTRALNGMPKPGKKPPYGWRWVTAATTTQLSGKTRTRKVRLEPDVHDGEHPDSEDTATRIRAIWDWLDTPNPAHTLKACEHWLNEVMRWPSPTGKLWSKESLRFLIRQSCYWGEPETLRTAVVPVRVRDRVTGEYDVEMRQRLRPHGERIPIPTENWPPLISPEQAARVHAYMGAKRDSRLYGAVTEEGAPSRRAQRQWNPDDYLLHDGLARCGVCGHKLYVTVKRGGMRGDAPCFVYKCAAGARLPKGDERQHYLSISTTIADAFAVAQTAQLLFTPGEAEAALARLADQGDEHVEELATAKSALARTEKSLTVHRKLANLLEPDDEEELAKFAEEHRKLGQQRDEQAARVAALESGNQRVQSLAAALAAAVQAARETSAQYAATRKPLLEQIYRVHHEGDTSAQAQEAMERSRKAMEQALAAMQAASTSEQETVAVFEHAPKPKQRTVLQALGVEVVLLSNSGQEHAARDSAKRVHQRYKGEPRLRYELPLGIEASEGSETAAIGESGEHNKKLLCINFMPPIRRHG